MLRTRILLVLHITPTTVNSGKPKSIGSDRNPARTPADRAPCFISRAATSSMMK